MSYESDKEKAGKKKDISALKYQFVNLHSQIVLFAAECLPINSVELCKTLCFKKINIPRHNPHEGKQH